MELIVSAGIAEAPAPITAVSPNGYKQTHLQSNNILKHSRIMNIMQFLGFTKKGAEKPSEPVKVSPAQPRELINFSDKNPRAEG